MMTWHVISQVGPEDNYMPSLQKADARIRVRINDPDDPLNVCHGLMDPVVKEGLAVPETAIDLLNLAVSVFTADLRVSRSYSGDVWTRDFVLYIPVADLARWKELEPLFAEFASFLTGDSWSFQF